MLGFNFVVGTVVTDSGMLQINMGTLLRLSSRGGDKNQQINKA